MPQVSILLPCRNAESTLDEAITSLVGQTLADFEVIAVDDGSDDATQSRLSAWAERDSRICIIESKGSGIVSALNAAAAVARGDLLVRMDADDIAAPTRLERQVAMLHGAPDLAGCGTQIRYFPAAVVRPGARKYEQWLNSVNTPEEIERDLFIECPIPHPTLAIDRAAFDKVGGYRDMGWPEDYDLILRLWQGGYRMGKVAEVLLQWREQPARLSRTHPRYSEGAFRRCKVHFLSGRIGDRPVVICGAGPVGKAFALELQDQGHAVAAFVDLDPRKLGQNIHGAKVIDRAAIAEYNGAYCLAAVASPAARQEIRQYLSAAAFNEVGDFCAVA